MEGGTLQQLRNLIGRRNIGLKTNVKGHVNDVENFLVLVIRCHLITAAMHFFSMSSVKDTPHSNAFPPGFAGLPLYKRKKIFFDRLFKIIDRYVIPKQFLLEQPTLPQQREADHNPHLSRVIHEHSYSGPLAGPVVRHLPSTTTDVLDRAEAPQSIKRTSVDGVLSYASAVLE